VSTSLGLVPVRGASGGQRLVGYGKSPKAWAVESVEDMAVLQ
jgi:hypothetical protein